MASLMKKVQTLISANLHAMVDSALKANSLAVFDQYVREVEDNLESVFGAFPHKGKKPIDFKALREETAEKVAEETMRVFEKGSRTG